MNKIKFVVEKTKTGYSAYSENYNASTTATTYKKLKSNMLDSVNLLLEHQGKKVATDSDITVKFNLQTFFELFNGVNILAISEKYNLNNSLISQYKSGEKFPSEHQARKIINTIKAYGKELSEIDF